MSIFGKRKDGRYYQREKNNKPISNLDLAILGSEAKKDEVRKRYLENLAQQHIKKLELPDTEEKFYDNYNSSVSTLRTIIEHDPSRRTEAKAILFWSKGTRRVRQAVKDELGLEIKAPIFYGGFWETLPDTDKQKIRSFVRDKSSNEIKQAKHGIIVSANKDFEEFQRREAEKSR